MCSCGKVAQQWAYNHKDPNFKTGEVDGYTVQYSVNPEYYDPMCISCHKRFDLERRVNENA